MQAAKNFLANSIAALLTSGVCWFVLAFFDSQTGRACIYAICLTLGATACGVYSWGRDKLFLRIDRLFLCCMVVVAIIFALLLADTLYANHHLATIRDVKTYLQTPFPSIFQLLVFIVGLSFLPFFFASLLRACVIWLMCNVFGATAFGIESDESISLYNERAENSRGLYMGNEGFVLMLIGVLWPGAWAIHTIRYSNLAIGIAVFVLWCFAYIALAYFLHQRQIIVMQFSLPAAMLVMLSAATIVW